MEKFLVTKDDAITTIRFNTEATMNALSMEMAAQLIDLLDVAERESGAIVIGGGARAFCSGADLTGGPGGVEPGQVDAGVGLEQAVNPLMLRLKDLRVPLITAVRGAAAGVGASLAMIGDIIVAGHNAYFLQAFCRIGLVPDGGSAWLLAKAVGRVRALELMLLGEKLTAQDAHAWGLVTRLVADDAVDATATDLARRLASGPRTALGLIRRVAWAGSEGSFAAGLDYERQAQTEAGFHPDFVEGVAAFLGKRKARFGQGQ